MSNTTAKVIGVAGFARAGKDTFVKVARKILKENGYSSQTLSFARGLKDDLDDWLKEKYGISAWTEDTAEKQLIRPFLVAHGCGKRIQTEGRYWIDKVDEQIRNGITCCNEVDEKHVFFISDVRFPNEEKWLHQNWAGWLVHLKKYSTYPAKDSWGQPILKKQFDSAPNEEEAKNDPLVLEKSDVKLELENVIEREKVNGNIITVDSLVDNSYLNEEIKLCLAKCPFLKLTTPKP